MASTAVARDMDERCLTSWLVPHVNGEAIAAVACAKRHVTSIEKAYDMACANGLSQRHKSDLRQVTSHGLVVIRHGHETENSLAFEPQTALYLFRYERIYSCQSPALCF